MVKIAVSLALLMLLGACKPAEPPAQSLDDLVSEYAQSQRREGGMAQLADVSAETFLLEIQANRDLLARVRDVDPTGLSPDEDIDRRLLIGLLESDVFTAEERRIWEVDPALYVPAYQVGQLLGALLAEPSAESVAALSQLLAQVPARMVIAKENLENPPQRFTEAAIFKTQGTIGSIEEGIAASSDFADAEFQRVTGEALAALRDYEAFLEKDLLPRSTGTWAAGKAYYDYVLQHRWFLDADADDILARGLAAFEETEALAQQVSERIEPGKHWSEVYETLKDEHPPADGIKAAYQASMDAAREFVIQHQIVTLPEGERVVTVDTPPAMRRSSPFGTFQSVDAFGEGLEGRLVLTPIESWMTPEQQAGRLRSHHDAWIPVIAVHEAYPGHHVAALKVRENPRLLRKIVHEPIFSEGWGLLTEELMFEQGFLVGDDVRLTQLRNRLWRAARVILDVSLHTGRMTFEEAVDFLAERVRFERYAAELEVGMYIERPTYVLGYLIGMEEIMDIREEWIATFGEPNPPSAFYDALLTAGAIPPMLVRESMLGDRLAE